MLTPVEEYLAQVVCQNVVPGALDPGVGEGAELALVHADNRVLVEVESSNLKTARLVHV